MAITPVNKAGGAFRGGVGGTLGPRGQGTNADLSKRLAAKRAKAVAPKPEKKPQGFLGDFVDDIGLDDFYENDVLPTVGRVFGSWFEIAKKTRGASIPATVVAAPYVIGATAKRALSDAEGKREIDEAVEPVGDAIDYAAKAVKAGAGIAKTEGWDPAKKFVAPAVDTATRAIGGAAKEFADTAGDVDDFLSSEAPVYEVSKKWANRNAVKPTKDLAAEVVSRVTGQPVNERILAADDADRLYIYQSNDITQRGMERESAATPAQRERWMRMAMGQYQHPAWRDYESPFSQDQLARMSDYELVNAAYGTHTTSVASLWEAAKNNVKMIGAMPAALQVLSDQITDADKRGDYRGLGNMAEFMARQALSTIVAVNNASLYAASAGQVGDYKPLVRALKTEPIFTPLDAAAVATGYGKIATSALKTGGAVSKIGAAAARVPGAVPTGAAIARGAETAAAVPVAGAPLRAAAAAARAGRRLADVERVEVFDPEVAGIRAIEGVEIGPDRVFRPTSSLFSKATAVLRKRLYEGTNPVSRAIYRSGERADARTRRAVVASIAETLGTDRAAPIIKGFTDIYKEDPDLALRVMWDLSGAESFRVPTTGVTLRLTPGTRADELEMVLNGKLWVRRAEGDIKDDAFRFSDESPGDDWAQVVPDGVTPKAGARTIPMNKTEIGNTQANIALLRKLDEIPEEKVAAARERLEAPYAEQFGERIGRALGGQAAPSGSMLDVVGGQEFENIRALSALGVRADPRVADLPAATTERLRQGLGIGAPTGVSRRQEENALIARLQDETVARLLPLVGDEFRAEVERILNEQLVETATNVARAEGTAIDLRRSAARVEDLEREIEDIRQKLAELGFEGDPDRPPMTAQETAAVWERFADALSGVIPAFPDLGDVQLRETHTLPRTVVFGEKTGDATGSNVNETTGFWRGTDGVDRYVKLYDTGGTRQAIDEFVANEYYRILGIPVPNSHLVEVEIPGGKKVFAIATDIVDGEEFVLTRESARDVLRGFIADALLGNWDAAGLNLDNLIQTPNGVVRIDQGGALRSRAQGALKSDAISVDLEDFLNKNPSYEKIIRAAGYDSIEDIPGLQEQWARVLAARARFGAFEYQHIAGRVFDELTDEDFRREAYRNFEDVSELIDNRFANLKDDLSNNYGVRDPRQQYNNAVSTLMSYMGSGHRFLNEQLREAAKKADGPVIDAVSDAAATRARNLDYLMDTAPVTDEPMVLYRGLDGLDQDDFDAFQADNFTDYGFVSTSFSPDFAYMWANKGSQNNVYVEIYVPQGSKGVVGEVVRGDHEPTVNFLKETNRYSEDYGEYEFILPRETAFQVIERFIDDKGITVIRAIAVTPGSELAESVPTFGKMAGNKLLGKKKSAESSLEIAQEDAFTLGKVEENLARALDEHQKILDAQKNIDFVVESLIRDAIEASDIPTGARVFIPTLGGPKGARSAAIPQEALAGRGGKRDLLDIYTGQFAMLGSTEDLQKFSGALARNLRLPFVAYETVTRLTDYLMRTGTVIRFAEDAEEFKKQIEDLADAGLINGNGVLGSDYKILPINEKTGFFDRETFDKIDVEEIEEVGTKGRSDIGVDDAQVSSIVEQALKKNALDNLASIPKGSTIVIVSRARYDTLLKEMRAAAQNPSLLRRITRQWVRFTLTTLPRTPIANVVGSAFLSALGGGLGGYPEALRLLRASNAPPELRNNGFAGLFNEGGSLVVPAEGRRFALAQKYMNYLYYYNVMGEDLARLAAFVQAAKSGLKSKKFRDLLDAELADAQDLDAAFQTLLEAVARGEYADGRQLTPELIRIRDDALQKADDFLGGARGLTSRQRAITTFVPFWTWYKHIFKLYFYTLPAKYPVRTLTMNAMARYGAEESRRNGFFDSFWEDAIKVGEEARGPNIYSRALATNIFPFTFGNVLDADEGAPGVSFAASNVAPTLTVPLRLAGVGIPGLPLITPEGERLDRGEFFSPETGEVALSEIERLFAPAGLAQRYLTPRGSLLLGAGRLATGRDIPQAEPRGQGAKYAVTPRGVEGLGAGTAALEALGRAFGLTVERIPTQGPVARRRLKQREEEERRRVLERYKEERAKQRAGG